MDNDTLPQYMQIALSIAGRIAGGDVPEGTKISGRSKLSSEYNVSPETIRKAVRLLGDMRVVDVREKSGVYVLSADNAKRYLHDFEPKLDVFSKRRHLTELLEQQNHVSQQLADLCRSILDYAVLPVQADDTLPNYIFRVPKGWNGNGRNLGELHFWQATGATIVAIRRVTSRIVSPGPYAELYGGDEIIFVGTDEAREAVSRYFSETG
jgi:K+/H+ antiporter YhaU regulatory subunit KhtT